MNRTKEKARAGLTRIAAFVAAVFAAGAAFGADNVWTGVGDGYWESSGNWTAFATGDYWLINSSATSKNITFNSEAAHAYNFTVATDGVTFSGEGSNGLRQSASDIRIGTWAYGALSINSGTHVFNELAVASAWWDNTGAIDGKLTINGGNLTVNGASWIGSGNEANASGTDGVIDVVSGSLTFVGTPTLGDRAGTTGTLNINGGTVSTATIVKGAGTATVNLNDGTLKPTADGTLIGEGVTLTVGATESVIELTGQTVTIAGDVTGTGSLTIKGYGSVTINGNIDLPEGRLTVEANNYYSTAADTYTLSVTADAIIAGELAGSGDITTINGISAGNTTFYGKISGAGDFSVATSKTATLYGLNDFAGGVKIGANASLALVSSLDGISPLWRVDASDANSITTNAEGNVTAWASQVTTGNLANGSFLNETSSMALTEAHFGGKKAVLTNGSKLTSSWLNDGGRDSGQHTDTTIGAVCVESHSGSGAILLQYDGVSNRYVGRRSAASNWDYWVRMKGSRDSTTDGIWQNGIYQDTTYHNDERIVAISGFDRQSSVTSISIGGGAGSIAIGEYMGFANNPTTAQRKQIETYLANKWNIDGMGKSLPQVAVTMEAGATLDLGGLKVEVESFDGAGVVQNGALVTAGNTYTQGNGDLTIPAVEGGKYYASVNDWQLIITGASGKNVTIVIPEERVDNLGGAIFCEGDGVTFMTLASSGEETEMDTTGLRHLANGWWHVGDFVWTGRSSSEVKYWSDQANWNGYDLTDTSTNWRIDKAAEITFTENIGPAHDLLVSGGPVTFRSTGDNYGYAQNGGWCIVGAKGDGELDIQNGTHQLALDLHVGRAQWGVNPIGVFTLQGGIFRVGYWMALGDAANGYTSTGIANIDGGELVIGYREGSEQSGNSRLNVGTDANCTGIINQTGGVVSSAADGTPNADDYAMVVGLGENSVGAYTISGGDYIARKGKILLASGTGSKGTLNINGGTVTAAAIEAGDGEAAVNLNGGVLKATDATAELVGAGVTLTIGRKGGVIDTNGKAITIAATLKGTGMLTYIGGGSVALTGDTSGYEGSVAGLVVGAGETKVQLGNRRVSGDVVVSGNLKFGVPAEIAGCDLCHDFGSDTLSDNFENLGGEISAGQINGEPAAYSETFSVRAWTKSYAQSMFAVVQCHTLPNYAKLFVGSDGVADSRVAIQRHNQNQYWIRRDHLGWYDGFDGVRQNGEKNVKVSSDPKVISVVGSWLRSDKSPDKVICGSNSAYPMTWGEVLFYNRVLSDAERVGVEDYLMWKWKFRNEYIPLTAENGVSMLTPEAVIDLGGFELTVKDFQGCGEVKNGTLATVDNKYTQLEGDLTIPAVDGAIYYASSTTSNKLILTGGQGKSVKIVIPDGWVDESTGNGRPIFCEGTVNFVYEGENYSPTYEDGWWRFYESQEDKDAAMDAALAELDAELDSEAGLAFPGARGFGRFAKGARATSSVSVYHVRNLNASGSESFADAVSQPNRIIVFDVSGCIKISSRITFASNLYIAGQTAPGEGITVYGNGCSFSGASNIICRYIRWRMGHSGSKGKDCAGIANGENMIFDHCSFSWGLDETFSINPDGKGTGPNNITLQNCIFGQGLMTHSAGGLMQASNITLYRNFYCDNGTRNNKLKGTIQYVNNTVYNWRNGCVILGGDSTGTSYCNITGNLFINGPAGGGDGLGGGNKLFHFYGDDNWQDKNADGVFEPYLVTTSGGGDKVSAPYNYPTLPQYPGNRLLDKNLPTVGASLPYRDPADYYLMDEVLSYGKEGALITFETSLPIGSPSSWAWWTDYESTKPADSDGDGMPDWWEDANGTNKSTDDALTKASNGYYNIENYINSITAENRQFYLRAPLTPKSAGKTMSSISVAWRDYTYAEDGFEVSYAPYGSSKWTVAGTTGPNATSFTVEGLTAGLYYNIRIRAFAVKNGSTVYGPYSNTVKLYTSSSDETAVNIDNYQPDRTWTSALTTWDKSSTGWAEGIAFRDGNKVLIDKGGSGSSTINVDEVVKPASVVVKGTGNITINGNGNLSGSTASINKTGTGTLSLWGENTFEGPVVNHGGTYTFNRLFNGGVASGLGKSKSFADNWVFDGGTFRYAGSNTSTDRDALLRAPSVFKIKSATVTMNGIFEGEGDFILDGENSSAILDVPKASFFGYTGATILRGGTLKLSGTGAGGSAMEFNPSQLIMAGGSLYIASNSSQDQPTDLDIEVQEGTYSTLTIPSRGNFGGTITGSGTLQLNIPYVRGYIGSNLTEFEGTIVGCSTVSGAIFMKNGSWNAPLTRFSLKKYSSNVTTYMSAYPKNTTNRIGGLSGEAGTYLIGCSSGSSDSVCTWIVGSANTDEEFNGVINRQTWDLKHYCTTHITKVGTGYWRLTGDNVHNGYTNVDGGDLIINGSISSSPVTVNDGGTLRGKGTVSTTVTVNNGGSLEPGDTTIASDKLTLNGGVYLNSGAKVVIPVGRDSSNNLMYPTLYPKSGSTFSIGSNVTLSIDLSQAGQLSAGDKIWVFSNSTLPTFSGTFANVEPAAPGPGLVWNTSNLYTGRYITVESADWRTNATQWGTSNVPYYYEASWKNSSGTATGVSAGNYYKLDGNGSAIKVNTNGGSSDTFGGSALWCLNGSMNAPAALGLRAFKNTVADLRLGEHGGVSFDKKWDNGQTLSGTVTIQSTDSKPAYIMGGDQNIKTLESSMSGYGSVVFRPHTSVANGDTHLFYINLVGDNSGYGGKMAIENNGSSANRTILTVWNGNALGNVPEALLADALTIRNSLFVVYADVWQPANRGITIDGNAEIGINDGCTYYLSSPIAYKSGAKLVKSGDGTLNLCGQTVTVPSFEGVGVVESGTLLTTSKSYAQGAGPLTIPAVEAAEYVASAAGNLLTISDGAGKNVKVRIPDGWLGSDEDGASNSTSIYCEGNVSFILENDFYEATDAGDGWWSITLRKPVAPIVPGDTVTGLSEAQANAITVTPTNADALEEGEIALYRSLFTIVKQGPDANGKYSVTAAMTEDGTNAVAYNVAVEIEPEVTEALAEISVADGDKSVGVTGIPGLYYSVESGNSVNGRVEGGRSQAGHGGAVNLVFPHYPGMGFYRILVNILGK